MYKILSDSFKDSWDESHEEPELESVSSAPHKVRKPVLFILALYIPNGSLNDSVGDLV